MSFSLSSAISNVVAGLTGTGQKFSTIPTPNQQLALYTLSIRSPGVSAPEYLTWTFPISPRSVQKTPTVMTTIYDSPGTPQQQGVNREVNLFGQTPPTFHIEGTTGWQRHQTDGLKYTGLQAMAALEQLFSTFAVLNQQQIANGQGQLYTMEFYDYFRGDSWVVVPVGPQDIVYDATRPLLGNFRLTLVGIRPVGQAPQQPADEVDNNFSAPADEAVVKTNTTAEQATNNYVPQGVPSTKPVPSSQPLPIPPIPPSTPPGVETNKWPTNALSPQDAGDSVFTHMIFGGT